MIHRLQQLRQDARGATIVEFGFVALPLCILLLGTLDVGYQMYTRVVMQGALNDVARAASVETPNIGNPVQALETRVETEIRTRVQEMARGATVNVQAQSYMDYAGVGRPERLVTDVNNNGRYDSGDCWQDQNPNGTFDLDGGRSGIGGAQDVVFYRATFIMPRLLPMGGLVGWSNTYNIRAETAVRMQPFANQRQPDVRC